MKLHIQTATPVQAKSPNQVLLEEILGPDRVHKGTPHRLVRAMTAIATARDLRGNEVGAAALLEVDMDKKPVRLFLIDAEHKEGDMLIVDTALGRYLVTVAKTEKGLDGRGYVFAGGMSTVLELRLEGAMFVRGEAKEDELSWGDIAHSEEFEGIRGAVAGHVHSLTRDEILGGKFVFRDGTAISGEHLLGFYIELKTCHRSFVRDGKKYAEDVLEVENAGGMRLRIVQGHAESLPDLEAKFAGKDIKPMAFRAYMDGYEYAGVMV